MDALRLSVGATCTPCSAFRELDPLVASIYSTQFAAVNLTGSLTTLYTVPAGFVAVVRDVSGFMTTTTVGEAIVLSLQLANVNFATFQSDGSTYQDVHWEGRVVMPAGESLQVADSVAAGALVVSGYLLAAP